MGAVDEMPETIVPMTLRDAFLEDPFFRSGSSSENKMVTEQREDRRSGRLPWLMPRKWMIPQLWDEDIFSSSRDSHLLGLQEDDTKMEISLDTTGYKPDELKVQAIPSAPGSQAGGGSVKPEQRWGSGNPGSQASSTEALHQQSCSHCFEVN